MSELEADNTSSRRVGSLVSFVSVLNGVVPSGVATNFVPNLIHNKRTSYPSLFLTRKHQTPFGVEIISAHFRLEEIDFVGEGRSVHFRLTRPKKKRVCLVCKQI